MKISRLELFEFTVPQIHALIALNLWIGASFVHIARSLFRRAVLAAVGGYEPGRLAGEDSELFLRFLANTETRFANLPDILILYRRHEQAIGFGRNEKTGRANIVKVGSACLSIFGRSRLKRQWIASSVYAPNRNLAGRNVGW